MPTNNPNNSNATGAKQLAGSAAAAAGTLGPAAVQLASGAGVLRTAADTIKGAALDKLLGPTAIFAAGMVGVLRTIKSIVDQTGILERGLKRIASIQQIQGKFETLLKSAEAAQRRLQELYKFTAKSPFDFKDIAEGNRVLEALTKGALSGSKGMEMIGDTAASTGQSFSETAEKVGKLYNALRSGRSIDKVMFQLQYTGVVTDELARKLETLEQSGADFNQMWAAVEQQLARTSGGMKNEMKNLDALQQRLKNANEMFAAAFGASFVNAQATAIENTIKATENLTPLIGRIGADLAPIFQWTSLIRGKIYDWVLATKGFATALGVAYEVAKAFAVAVTGGALASMAATMIAAIKPTMDWAKSLAAAAAAQQLIGPPTALFLHAEAAKAAAAGNLLNAASLKLQAFWSTVSTAAVRLHNTALMTATATTKGFSVATYLSSVAAGVATGAWTLFTKAIGWATRGMIAFAAANPILAITAGAIAASMAFHKWADAMARTNQQYVELVQNSAKATRALREQAEAVRDLDQYRAALANADREEERVKEEIRALGAAPNKTMLVGHAMGATEVANPAYDEFRRTKEIKEEELRRIRATRAGLKNKDVSTLGLSQAEQSAIVDNAEKERRLQDAREQAEIDRADDAQRAKLLRARAARLAEESDKGRDIAAARNAPERFKDNPTDLMKVAEAIRLLEAAGQQASPALIKLRADLAALADSHQDKRAQAIADADEAKRIEDAIKLKEIELNYDRQIADVRAAGGETAALEAEKELATMREQLRIAEAKGEAGKFEAEQIRARIALAEAEQSKFRADRAVDRAANNALINNDRKAAKALQDAAELAKVRDEYAANGLSREQADADFASSVRAQAMQQAPRIVADSLQRVGGGGGSAGADPMLAAQKRIEAYQAAMVTYLRIIAAKDGATMR